MSPKLPRRRWTPAEDEAMARDYARLGGPALAAALGRTARAVYQRADFLGLTHRPRTDTGPAFLAAVRDGHARGLSDAQMAAALGCERHTVAAHRRAMGLGVSRLHPAQRARVAERTRRQCRDAGVGSLGGVRSLAHRRYAAASGWPGDLRPREVHILDALADRGPMTRPEIAEAVGLPWVGTRSSLRGSGEGGTYLATLVRAGLVVDLGPVVPGGGRGRNRHLYSLALDAERRPADG